LTLLIIMLSGCRAGVDVVESTSAANADVFLILLLRMLQPLSHADAGPMEPLFAGVALNHKEEAIVSPTADAILLAVE
jgi:hypothetical protein